MKVSSYFFSIILVASWYLWFASLCIRSERAASSFARLCVVVVVVVVLVSFFSSPDALFWKHTHTHTHTSVVFLGILVARFDFIRRVSGFFFFVSFPLVSLMELVTDMFSFCFFPLPPSQRG